MRILMILEREFPEDDRVEKEALSLIKERHEVHIACFTQQHRPLKEGFKNIILHRKRISNFVRKKASVLALSVPIYFKFWRQFLNKIIRRETFDIIYVHDLPLAKVGFEIAKRSHAKFVLDLHENWTGFLSVSKHTNTFLGKWLSPIYLWERYEKKYTLLADCVVVIVEEARKRLIKKGVSREKIIVVSNTISIPFTVKPIQKNKTFTFIYAGGITYHRGLQYALRGLFLLRRDFSNWNLIIVGTGNYLNELKRLTKRLGITNQVYFAGHQPYAKMMAYVASADCGLIPHLKSSHTDYTIPNKLFQYMYLKKPVLASNCNPIQRIVKESKSGLIYDFNHPEQFAKCALKIIQSPNNLWGENGYRKVIEQYNWQMEEITLVKMLEKCVEEKS